MKTLLIKGFETVNSKVLLPRTDKQNILVRKNSKSGGLLVFQMATNIDAVMDIVGGMFVLDDFSEVSQISFPSTGVGKKVRVRLDRDYAFMYLTTGAKVVFKHFPAEMNDFTSPYIDFSQGFSKVWDFQFAFEGLKYFNESINSLDFSECETLKYTFSGARNFNQPVDHINVSSIQNMIGTFNNAECFNQDLSGWDFHKNVNLDEFLNYSGLSAENYSKFLIKMNSIDFAGRVQAKVIGAKGLICSSLGLAARASLISKGWDISDATV